MLSSSKISFTDLSYEENALQSSWGGVYYHPIFINSAADILNLKKSAFYINIGDLTVGAVNLLSQDRKTVKVSTIPHLFQYFGILFFTPEYEKALLNSVIKKLEQEYDYLYLCYSPEFQSINNLDKTWNLVKCTTLGISGDDFKKWGNGFKNSVKNKINKAVRENVIIRTTEKLPADLWKNSYDRSGLPTPISVEQLTQWSSILVDNSLLKIYTAEIDGKPIAFRGELIYGDFAYDWIAGSDPEYNSTGANQLLMSKIGDDFQESGIKVWDLVDARIESIASFKKSFGSAEYHHWQTFKGIGVKGSLFNMIRKWKNG